MQHNVEESSDVWRVWRRVLVGLAILATLIGLFYAEEDVRGRLAWNSYKQQATARGVELDRHALEPAPVPDDQNFAMTPFLAPLLDYSAGPLNNSQSIWNDEAGHKRAVDFATAFSGDGIAAMSGTHGNPEAPLTDLRNVARGLQKKSGSSAELTTRAEEAAEILRDTTEYKPVLEELRAASQRPYSRFNVHYHDEDPARMLLPHLAVLKRAGQLAYYRASAELALGRKDDAYDDVGLLISIANSFRTEPIMISQLVRVVLLNEAQQLVWEGLAGRAWDAKQLQDLQARLEKLTVLDDALRAAHWEHAEHGSAIFDLMRSNPGALSTDLEWGREFAFFLRVMPSGWTYLEQVSYNRIYDDLMQGIFKDGEPRVPAQELERSAKRADQLLHLRPAAAVFHHRIFAAVLIPSMTPYFQKMGFCETMMDESVIACALERYRLANGGQYPGALDALTPNFAAAIPNDVITGEPLKYNAADGAFTLYSVGWNEKDDGGQIVLKPDGRSRELTKGDWAWQPYQ